MTAEIVITNRQAIVLAADSAVTIGKERVWKSSNKLFSLGPINDIAVMVNGLGEFCGYPWETIVKLFREETTDDKFKTTKDCAEKFCKYLSNSKFEPDEMNEALYYGIFLDILESIKNMIPSYNSKRQFRAAIVSVCEEQIDRLSEIPEISGYPTKSRFIGLYSSLISSMARDVFEETITKQMTSALVDLVYESVRRQRPSSYHSGVVVAGFGSDEIFPCIYSFIVDGRDQLGVRYWMQKEMNFNEREIRKTSIVPFGQDDIFHLFMEGISPEYIRFLWTLLSNILNSKSKKLIQNYVPDADRRVEAELQRKDNEVILKTFFEEFKKYRRKQIVQPILDVVRALPKDELVELAAALVELTSLRRKVDSRLESVGGPVDVAVISKGDGLVWIRRKHYFDIDKNNDFLYRKQTSRRSADASK